ncbi:Ig-like domain-containing protein [Vibrio rotiferianus]|uniref:Ig-like domain-containing protein n=1 Tax=Vibrio rotiferianus TaxID=190895 RepID=UPI00406A27CC
MIENEWYSLTVAVRDELGNQAIATSRFKYVPENIIELGTLVTLPVDSVLYTTNTNTPVTAVIFNPMTVEGGQMASGLHDYYITVGSQSTLPISVDGFEIGPGESKLLSVDFGNGDEQIIIPVSARGGEIGTSNIMVEIPQLKSKYN